MNSSSYYFLFTLFLVIYADIQQIDVQQDERIQLECILRSRVDLDGVDDFLSSRSIVFPVRFFPRLFGCVLNLRIIRIF